jgi:tetratricopeptide (TPR) repeat protein
MSRSAVLGAAVAALVALWAPPAWARGFGGGGGGGGSRGGGGYGGGGFRGSYGGGGFSRVPSATRMNYGYRGSSYSGRYTAPERTQSRRNFEQRDVELDRAAGVTALGTARAPAALTDQHWQAWHNHNWQSGWYHGNWHGNWDNNWNSGWNGWSIYPWYAGLPFWGVTGWLYGPLIYGFGYIPYYNPYAGEPVYFGSTEVDFGQPFAPVEYSDPQNPGNSPPASPDALSEAEAARQAFHDQLYDRALDEIDNSLAKMPGDPALQEFRALVLFALGRYQPAAAAVHSLLAVGPGWDWTTMISLYPSVDVYTRQLRALEDYRRDHPDAADARFLLAYHYLTCGHTQAAARELKEVVRLVPRDQVAAQLLGMVTHPASSSTAEADKPLPQEPQPQPTADANANRIDPASLVGTWTARREDGSAIQLTITPDSKFTWKFTQGDKSREFSGTSTVTNNLLVLAQDNGPSMVGRVVPAEGKGFRFLLVGGPPEDPGLTFAP